MGGAPHPFFKGKALGTRLEMPLFQSILGKFCQIFITLLLVSRTETYIYNTMCLLLTQILEARL